MVLEVEDELCPWNARRWRLTADASGAECKPTEEQPDATIPVATLASAYMGDTTMLAARADAGMIAEHRPGALRELVTAMAWTPKPWAGHVF